MHKSLVLLAAAATLGTAAIATPAAAAGQYHGHGYRDGDHRGGHRDEWRRERAWRWHHRHAERRYHHDGYRGYHGGGYYR